MLVSLQYLRGLAAVMIVYYHALGPLERTSGRVLPMLFTGYGVDLFFVISGMVMWLSTYGRRVEPHTFLVNRLVRIAPLYWSMTLLVAVLAWLSPALLRSTVFDLPHSLASLAFIPWRNPAYPGYWPVVIPGWTLNYEMFFYVLFAVALPLSAPFRAFGTVVALVALTVFGLAAEPSGPWAFYTNAIVLEFGLGVLAGCLNTACATPPKAVPIALLLTGTLAFGSLYAVPGVPRLVCAGLPSLMTVAGLCLFEKERTIRPIPFLGHLGDASYALYLSHPMALSAVALFIGRLSLGDVLPWPAILAVYLIVSIAIGSLVHIAIERPLTRFARALIPRPERSASGRPRREVVWPSASHRAEP